MLVSLFSICSRFSQKLPPLPEPGDDCECRLLFGEEYRPGGGCVRTMDLGIVENENLEKLLKFGPKF